MSDELSFEEKLRRLNDHHVSTVGAAPPAERVEQVAAAQNAQVDDMIHNAASGTPVVREMMARGMATAARMSAPDHIYRVIGPAANPGMVTMLCDHCGDTKVGVDPSR